MPGVYPAAPGGAINPPRKLLDQVRDALRVKHFSYRTEQAYVGWIRRFILFHDKRHPLEMGGPEVERFLTWLPQGSDGRRQPSNPSCGAGTWDFGADDLRRPPVVQFLSEGQVAQLPFKD